MTDDKIFELHLAALFVYLVGAVVVALYNGIQLETAEAKATARGILWPLIVIRRVVVEAFVIVWRG